MKQWLLSALFTALCVQADPSLARSFGDSYANFDWAGLNIELIDRSGGSNVPRLEWTDQHSSITAYLYPDIPISEASSDWTTPLDIQLQRTYFSANGTATTDVLSANSSARTDLSDLFSNARHSGSYASRSGTFSMSGNGMARLSLDWEMSAYGDGGINGCGPYGEGPECDLHSSGAGMAEATFSVKYTESQNQPGNVGHQVTFLADSGFGGCHPLYGCFDELSRTYVLEINSSGLGAATGEFSVDVKVWAVAQDNHPISAVPEADVYARLSAGLLLIAYEVRRRRRISGSVADRGSTSG